MKEKRIDFAVDYRPQVDPLLAQWAELRDQYLPIRSKDSIWRYSRLSLPKDPEQGWKLHIAATVFSAGRILQLAGPLLSGRGVLYKTPASLDEVAKLNAGIYYGYSQIGKFLTVYPQTTGEARLLARELHRLTQGIRAPSIPFDLKYHPKGCVYYRYGAFKALEVDESVGPRRYAVRNPEGKLVPDQRDGAAKPGWISDPFPRKGLLKTRHSAKTPLETTFKAFRALAQRGRGGVYQALDLSGTPPRICILKEGRKDGEVEWDGRDGSWRIKHEKRVLSSLADAGINVPRIYSSFKAENNYYLVTEFVDGENLEECLMRKKRRLSVSKAISMGIEIAVLLSKIHRAGWVWRDCKPRNIIRTRRGELRPIDFEGACLTDKPDPQPWGTTNYVPPEWDDQFRGQSRLPEDLYALGVVIFILLAGRPPDLQSGSLESLRSAVPAKMNKVLAALLDVNPRNRPAASMVATELRATLNLFISSRGLTRRSVPKTRTPDNGRRSSLLHRTPSTGGNNLKELSQCALRDLRSVDPFVGRHKEDRSLET